MSFQSPPFAEPLPIAKGGTGASDPASALENLGVSGGAFASVNNEAELDQALSELQPLIMILSDFAFSSDKNVDAGTILAVAPDINVALGEFALLVAPGLKLLLDGPGTLTYQRTVAGSPIQLGLGAEVQVRRCLNIENLSTIADTPFATSSEDQHYLSGKFLVGNARNTGIRALNSALVKIRDFTVEGPGTLAAHSIFIEGRCNVSDLDLEGSFNLGGIEVPFQFLNSQNKINGIHHNATGEIHIAGFVDGVYVTSFGQIELFFGRFSKLRTGGQVIFNGSGATARDVECTQPVFFTGNVVIHDLLASNNTQINQANVSVIGGRSINPTVDFNILGVANALVFGHEITAAGRRFNIQGGSTNARILACRAPGGLPIDNGVNSQVAHNI